MMDNRLAAAEALFHDALALGPQERQAFLQEACGADAQLREEVNALLDASATADNWLQEPVGPEPGLTRTSEAPGTVIGHYRLLEKIGEGGFGSVYIAQQEHPVRRTLALKIIKLGMDTRSVIARFEAERQALAVMSHPNIAKVLDAGATDTGRPYFVMELVQGVPITRFCAEHQLGTAERLELFIQVCSAIQHAHQKGIIHRDIKPSNVLVALKDGAAQPMVIDFGVAKALNQRLTEHTLLTGAAQMIGTPAYMSPEQAEMNKLDVDMRSDVYSLGVLLYELLTGVTPFSDQRLRTASYAEIQRIICQEEPLKPSTRLRRLTREADKQPAQDRGQSKAKTQKPKIAPDLDWIVMKCLEKDRARRYDTVNGLAADLRRFLGNEPIVARPPSRLYQFEKLVHRNKLLMAAAGAVSAVLVIGIVASTWQALRATRAEREQSSLRQQAENALALAEANQKRAASEAVRRAQVAQFMKAMLEGVGPSVAVGRDTTLLREILDQTAQRLNELTQQPAAEADLRATLGNVYQQLGEYTNSLLMHEAALRLRQSIYGGEHPEVASSMHDLGAVLLNQGRIPEAQKLFETALVMRRRLLGPAHPETAKTLAILATTIRRQRRFAEAEPMLREAIAIQRNPLLNDNLDLAGSLGYLGLLLRDTQRFGEAEEVHREVVGIRQQAVGEEHPSAVDSLAHLAHDVLAQGRYAEAESLHRQVLAIRRRIYANDHPMVGQGLVNLADALEPQGKLDEAEALLREALAIRTKRLGYEHHLISATLYRLGRVLGKQGKVDQARMVFHQELTRLQGLPGDHEKTVTAVLNEFVETLKEQANMDEALALIREWAERGNAAMQRRLALMYENGEIVTKDMVEAAKWHRMAAEQGLAWSQHSLGTAYLNGQGVERDKSEAVKWFRKAAGNEITWSQYILGTAYLNGQGVERDESEALKWFRKAADHGLPQAQHSLGWAYARGQGVPRDESEAVKWFRKAAAGLRQQAENGDVGAMNELAWLLSTCTIPESRDGTAAVSFAEKAVAETKRQNSNFLDTLAAAHAEAGDYAKAVKVQKEAIAVSGEQEPMKEYLSRLSLYESNTPYHGP